MTFDLENPTRFVLRFRVPGWSEGGRCALNGSTLEVSRQPGHWAAVDRRWQKGDHLTIQIPMTLRTVAVDRQHPDRVAIMYGPVVLAQDEACCRRPFSLARHTTLTSRLLKEDRDLRFRILNAMPERHTRYLVPLYSLPPFWPYWVYFDLRAPPLY